MRIASAAMFDFYILGRTLNNKDPIPRENLVSISKIIAKGTLSERIVLLRWILDTRIFTIVLPADKHQKFNNFISNIMIDGVTSEK